MGKWHILSVLAGWMVTSVAFSQSPEIIHPGPTSSKIFIVKLKSPEAGSRISASPEEILQDLAKSISIQKMERAFPVTSQSNTRSSAFSLQNIYKIELKDASDGPRLMGILRFSPLVEYAEPYIPNQPLYIPNDPQANPVGGQQDYLPVIKAHAAWDLEKSDSSMVIGLVDTGVKMDHEDLGNIAYNYGDPINGLDDDGDGYIDNFHGWDIADKDNNPMADGHPHGSYVAGMSSGTVNNGKGMAGMGFNSKYLPVKIAETATQVFNNEFGGVIYAADHGCGVINLSWGAAGNYTRYGQDVINYAVLERDAVVVAAAGNTDASLNFFPASFDNVLSVGSTDIYDKKAPWATYGYAVDLMAPGNNVYTTNNAGTYGRTGGSSYSAPLVSGAAALLRAHFPELSAQQVMEQLRITADDIYNAGNNMDYYGQLGKGRLNVFRALTDSITPSVRVSKFDYAARFGHLLFPDDTVAMGLTFTNYLRTAENVTVSITNPSGNTNLGNNQIILPKLMAMEDFTASPLSFKINSEAHAGEKILFRLDYAGDNYSDFQYLEMQVAPGYFDITDGLLSVTVASDGDIGYDDPDYTQGSGIGFKYDYIGTEAGLIVSTDSAHVMDNVIRDIDNYIADIDFVAENSLRPYDNSTAKMDARSAIKPANNSSALPLKIEQKILAWEPEGDDGSVVFEYRLINIGDTTLNNLNTAIYTDWDLGDRKSNKAAFSPEDRLAYIFEKTTNELYAGIALLSDQEIAHYAIDLGDFNGNPPDIGTIFSDSLKHAMITSLSPKTVAGATGDGNDVSQILGAKNITLHPGQSTKVALAMLASTSLDGLKNALQAVKSNYLQYLDNPPVVTSIISCAGDSVSIDPPGEIYEFFSDLELTNRLDSGAIFETGPLYTDTAFYAVNLDSAYRSDIVSLVVKTENPVAIVATSTDSLDLAKGNTVTLSDISENAMSTFWIVPGGDTKYDDVLVESFELPGDYPYSLIAESQHGCIDSTMTTITVYRITGLENRQIPGFIIFPNPAKNQITLRLSTKSEHALPFEIRDMAGKLIKSFDIPAGTLENEISLHGFAAGLYLIHGGDEVWKMVVNE
ncbi:MAG: S8/S53 family peptidase [Cyclobacteriaceae bacterium]|nr:S8/S53 family peptidase [Cyclobacteriaceae bacterium]